MNFCALSAVQIEFLLTTVNMNRFHNLADARAKIRAWRDEYNGERPHRSLAYRTPNEFAELTQTP
jgi:transposase InsO family protein